MPKERNPIADLRKSYQEWRPTKAFIEWACELESTPDETQTAELVEKLRLKPADAKGLFTGIHQLELAKFIVGRRGSASRLQWNYTLPSIAAVAKGEADKLEPIGHSSLPKRDMTNQLIEYVFPLRRDLKIKLSLPADFSEQDIVRLTAFLRTLPLANDQ
jgi:hypothetical protein